MLLVLCSKANKDVTAYAFPYWKNPVFWQQLYLLRDKMVK